MNVGNWVNSGHQIYFPVLIHEAYSAYPLVLQLRAGNSHSGKGVVGILRWLFWRLRTAWSGIKIILRGDAGFSLPEIINLCERSEVKYAFGFSSNAVLSCHALNRYKSKILQIKVKEIIATQSQLRDEN